VADPAPDPLAEDRVEDRPIVSGRPLL
jgi:hypothetical protein